ncbi:hypothetical protein [Shewanella glacialipiscicola]|uniref:hypothetical protein n=1 Tax=Shewanella glacialipiscicola TaxID=614069 RepID=UPI003D79643A
MGKPAIMGYKKNAYDKVWSNLLEMKEYSFERLTVDRQYFEIFIDRCGYTGINEDCNTEDELINYYDNVKKEISLKKEKFNQKYSTTLYISERNKKKLQYIINIKKSIKNIELNSIYLSPKVKEVSLFLENLVNNQFNDNYYTWEISELAGITEHEWYEHIISEYEILLNTLELEMHKVHDLAIEELDL